MMTCVCVYVCACLLAALALACFFATPAIGSGVKEVRGCRISTASRDEMVVDGL